MAVDIHNLIAAIVPDVYCDPSVRDKVKKIVKENLKDEKKKKTAYLEASKVAKLVPTSPLQEQTYNQNPHFNAFDLPYLKNPVDKKQVSYDFFGDNLEPTYFWLVDTIAREYKQHKLTEKLIDNFVASPGSGMFSDLGMKATKMQEEAMKLQATANTVVRTILNLIYDLKEFKMRLGVYDKLHSKKKEDQEGAMFALKQIWMDTVDIKRGNSSIKMLTFGQGGQFVTLIDAFMAAKDSSLKDASGNVIDLNERVKRILQQRMVEFELWLKESERELRKRFEIEKLYLKSQVNSIKLYARWAKPYFKAARSLEQRATPTAALVNTFNTSLFELVLMSRGTYDLIGDTGMGVLPKSFREPFYGGKTRKFFTVLITDMKFRVSPGKVGQNYSYRGRLEVDFSSYVLTDQEIEILKDQVEQDDLSDVLSMIEGATEKSLAEMQFDIDEFTKDPKEEKKDKKEDDENPFTVLFDEIADLFKKKDDKKKFDKYAPIKEDSVEERVFRSQAINQARGEAEKIVGMFKKSLNMPAL